MAVGAMSVDEYIHRHVPATSFTVGDLYGTEHFCHFLYSLVRMDRPSVIVELGCGGAATALMAARALRENAHGHLWTVDNGSDWSSNVVRGTCQGVLDELNDEQTYAEFVRGLLARFELADVATLVEASLDGADFFDPGAAVDMIFSDATPSHVEGCLSLLRYYLPRMSPFSSIFIDRAGTINHAFLFLKYVVEQLNRGKIPWRLTDGLDAEKAAALERLVRTCDFQLINLTETRHGKQNKGQNSRAWIKIQPVDYAPRNDVLSFGSITSPWEMQ